MEGNPLVSVIINCFNGEEFLREAIDSVLAQTYTHWEIIFWDNQSTDATAEIVKSYTDSRIRYYYAPNHTPLGEARNLAVEKAKGEYINFLDADDIWMPNKLEEQIKLIEPGVCEVVYSPFEIYFSNRNKKNKRMLSYYQNLYKPDPHKTTYQNLLFSNWIIFSSVIFNKSLFVKVGGVNSSFKQNEDYDVLLKCSLQTKFRVALNTKIYYRVHTNNNSLKNGDVHIYEMRTIFSQLPFSVDLEEAKAINEARFAIYLWRKRQFATSMLHICKLCRLKALVKIIYNRFFKHLK